MRVPRNRYCRVRRSRARGSHLRDLRVVFDALLSARPYKGPWPLEDAIAELERLAGTQLIDKLVRAFLPLARDLHREWFVSREAPRRRRPSSALTAG